MIGEQLSLLDWRPPARLIPFPADRMHSRVRDCAETLSQKHGKAAEIFWRKTVRSLSDEMERAGIPEAAIKNQIRAFFDSVQAELVRMAYVSRPSGGTPPGAA